MFPTTAMRETLERVMAERGREALQYHWATGYEPLRAQILGILRARGIAAKDDELLITNGAQQALDLLARLLLAYWGPARHREPDLRRGDRCAAAATSARVPNHTPGKIEEGVGRLGAALRDA